jgi:hypothetical protein
MNTFKVRNNRSKKLQKNTNNKHPNSPVIMGKKTPISPIQFGNHMRRKIARMDGLMKIQKRTNNANTNISSNSPVSPRRKPTTSVRKPVNKTNLRIAQLLMKKQGLQREMNITNAAIRVLKSRK